MSSTELEEIATKLRHAIARNPEHSQMEQVELEDVKQWIAVRQNRGFRVRAVVCLKVTSRDGSQAGRAHSQIQWKSGHPCERYLPRLAGNMQCRFPLYGGRSDK